MSVSGVQSILPYAQHSSKTLSGEDIGILRPALFRSLVTFSIAQACLDNPVLFVLCPQVSYGEIEE